MIARHFAALLRLKFQLWRNTLTGMRAVSSLILAAVLTMGAAASVLLGAAAYLFASEYWIPWGSAVPALLVLDAAAILFAGLAFWGLLFQVHAGDPLNPARFLHLPIRPSRVFLLNFAASLISAGLALFLVPAVCFCLGLARAFGPQAAAGALLALIAFLAQGAWLYWARGAITAWMRRSRAGKLLLAAAPITAVAAAQLPLLLAERVPGAPTGFFRLPTELPEWAPWLHAALPPLWMPYGVYRLAEGAWLPAIAAAAGLLLLMALGLALGFRSAMRFATRAGGARKRASRDRGPHVRTPITLRRAPGLHPETAACFWAMLAMNLRHIHMRTMLLMALVMGGILIAAIFRPMQQGPGFANQGAFFALMIVTWPYFTFASAFFNLFGADRNGFRALMLLPVPRYRYLLAKNLALLPFVLLIGGALAALYAVVGQLQPAFLLMLAAVMLQIFLVFAAVGNYTSIYLPIPLDAHGMRPAAPGGITLLMGLLSLAVTVAAILPGAALLFAVMILGPMLGAAFNAGMTAIAILLLTGAAGGYAWSLRDCGRRLQRREHIVLEKLHAGPE